MRFWTDGSCVGLNANTPCIGWSAICANGIVVSGSQQGGTNVNAELLAIRDLLKYFIKPNVKIVDEETEIEIWTDSKTAIQVIEMCKNFEKIKHPTLNHELGETINECIETILERKGIPVKICHMRGHGKDPSLSEELIIGNSFADYVANKNATETLNAL